MHVTINEAGHHQVAADIEDRHAVREGRFGILTKAGDTPTGNPDIDEMPVGQAAVGQNDVEIHATFLGRLCSARCLRATLRARAMVSIAPTCRETNSLSLTDRIHEAVERYLRRFPARCCARQWSRMVIGWL
jgi:hypothetical protein